LVLNAGKEAFDAFIKWSRLKRREQPAVKRGVFRYAAAKNKVIAGIVDALSQHKMAKDSQMVH